MGNVERTITNETQLMCYSFLTCHVMPNRLTDFSFVRKFKFPTQVEDISPDCDSDETLCGPRILTFLVGDNMLSSRCGFDCTNGTCIDPLNLIPAASNIRHEQVRFQVKIIITEDKRFEKRRINLLLTLSLSVATTASVSLTKNISFPSGLRTTT